MLHFYALTFIDSRQQGETTHAHTYVGIAEPKVTRKVIAGARGNANLSAGAVLLSVSYLGEMTEQEWHDSEA